MQKEIKKAEQFIKEAKAFGLEPSLFNVLNFLNVPYKWDKNEKKIEVSEKDKKLLEFIRMLLTKHFPRKGGSDEDSPM